MTARNDDVSVWASIGIALGQRPIDGPDGLLRGVIDLSTALGLNTIAEGVEHSNQFSLLRELGCHSVQGFLFARPMPSDQFAKRSPHDKPKRPRRDSGSRLGRRALMMQSRKKLPVGSRPRVCPPNI
jgi:predicted signal transduction protein with EAL and GGDEF domain